MKHRPSAEPLAILLPRPQLRRRSSLVAGANGGSASPRTPRSLVSPTCSSLFGPPSSSRRTSSDSWASSIDECEFDWYPDQILLLSRTLDALPSHLLTPFNGPVPPNNLLDKVARGIVDAKGSEWPHSVRATRLKLAEISRAHAGNVIPEENQPRNASDCFADSTNLPCGAQPRRPLHRQSSMDFVTVDDLKNQKESIDRLSSRLQRADRSLSIATSPYNTRSVSRRNSLLGPSSPARPTSYGTGPSTASSTTLASLASMPSSDRLLRPRVLRRSVSVLSTGSSTCASSAAMSSDRMSIDSIESCIAAAISSTESLVKPTTSKSSTPRLKRSDSFTNRPGIKRAPSYGAVAQEAKAQGSRDGAISPCSSDEEEKVRSRTVIKKARTKTSTDVAGGKAVLQESPKIHSGKTTEKKLTKRVISSGEAEQKRPSMNPKRNPSMFGAELPRVSVAEENMAPTSLESSPSVSPQQSRTLRRVKRLPASAAASGRPAVGRKISFGSLAPSDDAEMQHRTRPCLERLGSAFKLA